jgi:hypothetical protein
VAGFRMIHQAVFSAVLSSHGLRFAHDAPLEGTGFEPSVPPEVISFPGAHGSLLTPRWRKADSNPRSHIRRALSNPVTNEASSEARNSTP